jgi:4-carboxymuconolactone decarboxylase
MRLSKPRVQPLTPSEWDDDTHEVMSRVEQDGRVLNIYRTLAHHPKLFKRWSVFGTHVLYRSTLPARERELLILRTGYLCRSDYEWSQHVVIGKAAGITDEEIARIKEGPDASGWSAEDATVIRAADELHNESFISDATWHELSKRYDTKQLIDVVFAVGQYHLVSMALNTLGVQLEAEAKGFGD